MKDNPIYIYHIVNIQNLIDDAKCYETIKRLRWADGILQCYSARA